MILSVLQRVLPRSGLALEIGSGSGQHAAWFAPGLPQWQWQASDLPENLPSIADWAAESGAENLLPPVVLDLSNPQWPTGPVDAVVCINTIHIVAWPLVQNLFAGAAQCLRRGGVLYVYGPYRYDDRVLEPGNVDFDHWLKARDPESGIREFGAVNRLAIQHGLQLAGDEAMPANNRSIWWCRI